MKKLHRPRAAHRRRLRRPGARRSQDRHLRIPRPGRTCLQAAQAVQQVVISRQLSDKDCTRGRNWDVRKISGHDELWVRNGCRAEFTVRYDR